MTGTDSPVRADNELMPLLARIDAAGSDDGSTNPPEISQERADSLLAAIVWSRLAEPGDRTAGELAGVLGPAELLRLVSIGTSARRIIAAVRERSDEPDIDQRSVTAGLRRWLPRLDRAATLDDLERSSNAGYTILFPGDRRWPQRLDDLQQSIPAALWVRGDHRLLASPSAAVVGARASTGYGEHVTSELVDGMGRAGYTIVSGAAYGIDAVAHRTALAIEAPTVAVLAGGLDRPYPEAHRQLLDRIATSGAVCSEMVPGSSPTRWRFLQRNRLIAALTEATIVTEAGMRSGSLNTAGHAAEMGRPLGAVPGPVTNAASTGCHRLLREYGATLITGTADALELLGTPEPLDGDASNELPQRLPELHRRVLDALPLRGARTLLDVSRRAGLSLDEARGTIAELELLEFVRRRETPGGEEVTWSLERRE